MAQKIVVLQSKVLQKYNQLFGDILQFANWIRRENNGLSIKFLVSITQLIEYSELKRPTSNGLDTGPAMFTPVEIERFFKDKSVKRYLIVYK